MLKVVRHVPVAVYVTAGSCPRWPMSWTRFKSCMVIPPFAPRLEKESSNAFRKAKMTKTGVNGGKGAPERSGGAFIGAERKPLRQRGAKPPKHVSRSDSTLDAH